MHAALNIEPVPRSACAAYSVVGHASLAHMAPIGLRARLNAKQKVVLLGEELLRPGLHRLPGTGGNRVRGRELPQQLVVERLSLGEFAFCGDMPAEDSARAG